jgi:alginate O-acetyltransferase complex protein AlgJ
MKSSTFLTLKRFIHITLCIVFIIYLWLPLSQMKFKFTEIGENTEKRELTAFPTFSVKYPAEFILSFEKYFNDNFGFRNHLIGFNNKAMLIIFGEVPQAGVILGYNSWLFFSQGLVDNYKRPAFTQEQLVAIANSLEAEKKILDENGIQFITVIASDKHNVYTEYLPKNYIKTADNPRKKQQIDFLRKNTDVVVIDLLPALIKAKGVYPTYYKTDTHWNNYGSFIGYREVMKELKLKFPNLDPLALYDFQIKVDKKPKPGDLAVMLGLIHTFPDEEITLTLNPEAETTKLTPDKKLKKAIIYHDSFFDPTYSWNTIQYLSHHFDKVIDLSNTFEYDNEMIIKEKPDVVIYEIVERSLK